MRKLLSGLFILFLLSSCVGEATDASGSPITIFGHLSQIVQLGSTQETIGYKMQSETLFVTVQGEVLMNRPASFQLDVTDQVSGERVEDLTISIVLCQAVDEEIDWHNSCDPTVDGGIYRHELTAVDNGTTYVVDGFEWDRPGGWYFETIIEKPDGSQPEQLTFSSEIYPQRPPSSNAFELTNISLPFIVIAIFLGLIWIRGGQLIQPVARKGRVLS